MAFFAFALIFTAAFVAADMSAFRPSVPGRMQGATAQHAGSPQACAALCLQQPASQPCRGFGYLMEKQAALSGQKNCELHFTAFGLGRDLETTSSNWVFHARKIEGSELGEFLRRQGGGTPDKYLTRYRNGVAGRVVMDNKKTALFLTVESVEECAAACTRSDGWINYREGIKCDSFNYHDMSSSNNCELLPKCMGEQGTSRVAQVGWKYHERLKGAGCWITQRECQAHPHLNGTFQSTSSKANLLESECRQQARHYHERVCKNAAMVTTVAYYGPVGSFAAFNTWDLSEGCVINVGPVCPNAPERFPGVFRDSIGEVELNTGNLAKRCFERAYDYHTACGKPVSEATATTATFMKTGMSMKYPIPRCSCEGNGITKYDAITGRDYCTRANTSLVCKRSDGETYSQPDILCDDATCAPKVQTAKQCWITTEHCFADATKIGTWHDTDGDASEATCIAQAKEVHTTCQNSADMLTFATWRATGLTQSYPNLDFPLGISTSIRGLRADQYNLVQSARPSLWDVNRGRQQSFTMSRNATVRQVSIWFARPIKADKVTKLILELHLGEGTLTRQNRLEGQTLVMTVNTTEVSGQWVHFHTKVHLSGKIRYSWHLDGAGYVAKTPEGTYGSTKGRGDTSWDYCFVIWTEDFVKDNIGKAFELLPADTPMKDYFEPIFVALIAFSIFALMFLAYRRWRERVEKKRERERYDRRSMQEILMYDQLQYAHGVEYYSSSEEELSPYERQRSRRTRATSPYSNGERHRSRRSRRHDRQRSDDRHRSDDRRNRRRSTLVSGTVGKRHGIPPPPPMEERPSRRRAAPRGHGHGHGRRRRDSYSTESLTEDPSTEESSTATWSSTASPQNHRSDGRVHRPQRAFDDSASNAASTYHQRPRPSQMTEFTVL